MTRTATRPSMASFDQALWAADVSLIFGECGSAVAWSMNMNNMRTRWNMHGKNIFALSKTTVAKTYCQDFQMERKTGMFRNVVTG